MIDEGKSNSFKNFKTLRFFLRGSGIYVFCAGLFMLLGVAAQNIIPQITSYTVDVLLKDGKAKPVQASIARLFGGAEFLRENIYVVGLIIVGMAVLQGAFAFLRRVSSAHASETVGKRIRDTMYQHIQRLPFSWHSKMSTGDIIQRAVQDGDLIKRYVSLQFVELFRVVFMLIVSLLLMFSMNVPMTFIAMSLTPLTITFSIVYFPKISKRFKVTDEAEGALTAALQENLTGLRVVRTFGQQKAELERFEKKNAEYVKLWHKFASTLSVFWGSGDFFASTQALIILIAGAHFAASGKIETGELMAFITYNQMLIWPIRSIGRILAETGKARIALGRLNEVLEAQPEIDDESHKKVKIQGDIEFKNVYFSYDGTRNVLSDLSFKIDKGSTFAIIGATGSGKSTLTTLFNRLHEPTQGTIYVDGERLADINRSCLRSQVGLILQEPFLFSKSLDENLMLALKDAPSEQDKERYLHIASLDSTIKELDNGLNTMVGERGVTLSGGQKQRLVIARTLIQRPPIVIFDDSLSAVDTDTDAKIRRSLRENLKDTTIVLISHRVSSVMDADNILVLNEGHMEALGKHSQLLECSPTYRRLFELQSKIEEDEANG